MSSLSTGNLCTISSTAGSCELRIPSLIVVMVVIMVVVVVAAAAVAAVSCQQYLVRDTCFESNGAGNKVIIVICSPVKRVPPAQDEIV